MTERRLRLRTIYWLNSCLFFLFFICNVIDSKIDTFSSSTWSRSVAKEICPPEEFRSHRALPSSTGKRPWSTTTTAKTDSNWNQISSRNFPPPSRPPTSRRGPRATSSSIRCRALASRRPASSPSTTSTTTPSTATTAAARTEKSSLSRMTSLRRPRELKFKNQKPKFEIDFYLQMSSVEHLLRSSQLFEGRVIIWSRKNKNSG